MRRGCFLDHRHKHIKEQLDAVLSSVLQAEKLCFEIEKAGNDQLASWQDKIHDLANQLESQIKTFLSLCEQLMSKSKTNGVEELLRGCDWNGAYGLWTDD